MDNATPDTSPDPWAQWLLYRRHGNDPVHEEIVRSMVNRIRDRVLDGAKVLPDQILVDVGAGDGLITFGAFDRTGPTLRAILADISEALLNEARQRAIERGLEHRCTFVKTGAEELSGIADGSVDVVTSRAVLVYVSNKIEALRQFYRVLKPGGRISLGEPILRDDAMKLAALSRLLSGQAEDAANEPIRLYHRWRAAQLPSTVEQIRASCLTNFTERDLVDFCGRAGFHEIRLELHIDDRELSIRSWETFMNIAARPLAPTLRETLESKFTAGERSLLERRLRSLFDAKFFRERDAIAYISATKPK